MSLRGKINAVNKDFCSAMRSVAQNGLVDPQGGTYGTRKISGYVCNIHPIDDENDELRGTVDVQEFDYMPGEDSIEGAGLHKGVLCSAIQSNKSGMYIMPSLYSDVIIVQDPVNLEEYVMMCSHVDTIQLQSKVGLKVGVVETEPFKEDDEDSPDMDDLKETGNSAYSEYSKNKIIHTVKTPNGDVSVSQSPDGVSVSAKDSVIKISADGSVTVSAKKVEFKGGTLIRKGKANLDGQGGFCGIPVCPFTGAVHTGSEITGG